MKGIVAAPGMMLAPARIISEPKIVVNKQPVVDVEGELARLGRAIFDCSARIERLMDGMGDSVDPQTIEILDFQLLLLEDTDFIGKIEQTVSEQHINAEYATKEISDGYIAYLEGLVDNEYLRERTADVADLTQQLIAVLSGIDLTVSEPDGAYIAIGTDLAPSVVAELDKKKLQGIILEKGGLTSHCAILAKSLGIPCLIKVGGILETVKSDEVILLDAISGEVVLNPNDEQTQAYEKYRTIDAKEKASLQAYINRASLTPDGAEIEIYANITTKAEAEEVVRQGGEGVGLFRSELLYMSQTHRPPSEEKQYAEYAAAAQALDGRPLVIRTLDVGGDKQIDYLDIDQEENPFLGYRAIRFCLDRPDIFKPQIAAILRAGAVGNVWMMFPMITCISEVVRAKQLVEQVKEELTERRVPFDPAMKVGIMVETPAAAFDAERLAREVDFFSLGTNDLSQYLFAADRTNANVAALNSHFQPTLLRVIHSVVQAAHKAGIEVDICGQAAEIDSLIPLWLSMGVDILSVSVPLITTVRKRLCKTYLSKCGKLLDTVLRLNTAEQVEQELNKFVEVM